MRVAGDEDSTEFDGRAFARTLTGEPGVYRMLGVDDQVLYVGKARNLRNRVESYFARGAHDARITSMVMQVQRIEVIVTRTEAEALLLESQLIKALKPRYNIELRDDKSYPWIRLTASDEYPRVAFHRGAKLPGDRYFGPFPSAWAVRETLNLVHKAFQLRQCEDSVFQHRSRPCLQHQIKRCSAPCVGLIDRHDYAADVRRAALVLEGKSPALIEELQQDMDQAARALEQYKAAYAIDAGHLQTLIALGRLYMNTRDWEQARRIYRSMLLQNLDPQVGMTRADVYLALGEIHEKIGEGPKAIGMYERGLELDPNHQGLLAAMGRVRQS